MFMCSISNLEMFYHMNFVVDLDSSSRTIHSAWLHKWQLWATCIIPRWPPITLEPLVLEVCVISFCLSFFQGQYHAEGQVKVTVDLSVDNKQKPL